VKEPLYVIFVFRWLVAYRVVLGIMVILVVLYVSNLIDLSVLLILFVCCS